jgi:hypothetical protein
MSRCTARYTSADVGGRVGAQDDTDVRVAPWMSRCGAKTWVVVQTQQQEQPEEKQAAVTTVSNSSEHSTSSESR